MVVFRKFDISGFSIYAVFDISGSDCICIFLPNTAKKKNTDIEKKKVVFSLQYKN